MENEKETKKEVETVVVNKADLKAITDRLAKLEGKEEFDPNEPSKEHTVRIKFWDGRPVYDVMNVRKTGFDAVSGSDKMACDLDVIADDGKIERLTGVDFSELIRTAPEVTVELVRSVDDEKSVTVGHVMGMKLEGLKSVPTGVQVPLKVKSRITIYEVRIPDVEGTVMIKSVNIA